MRRQVIASGLACYLASLGACAKVETYKLGSDVDAGSSTLEQYRECLIRDGGFPDLRDDAGVAPRFEDLPPICFLRPLESGCPLLIVLNCIAELQDRGLIEIENFTPP